VITTAECVVTGVGNTEFPLPAVAAQGQLYMVIRVEQPAQPVYDVSITTTQLNGKCIIDKDGMNVQINSSNGNVGASATFYSTGTRWLLVSRF
jgi:hypothetical protein